MSDTKIWTQKRRVVKFADKLINGVLNILQIGVQSPGPGFGKENLNRKTGQGCIFQILLPDYTKTLLAKTTRRESRVRGAVTEAELQLLQGYIINSFRLSLKQII